MRITGKSLIFLLNFYSKCWETTVGGVMQLDGLDLLQSRLGQKQKIVKTIFVGGQIFLVSGVGYNPHGNIYYDRQPVDPWLLPGLEECLIAGLLCNNSQLVNQDKQWKAIGDFDEAAMIALAYKAGLEPSQLSASMPRLDEIESIAEFNGMATLHDLTPIVKKNSAHDHVVYIKSMMDWVLDYCDWMLNLDGKQVLMNLAQIKQAIANMQDQGLDVIILLKKNVPNTCQHLSPLDLRSGLVFVGIQGIMEF
jgi:cation-transporting ATPase F